MAAYYTTISSVFPELLTIAGSIFGGGHPANHCSPGLKHSPKTIETRPWFYNSDFFRPTFML